MIEALLNRLEATPATLAHLVAELSDEALDGAGHNEWSARVILAHLRDDESMVMRMRLVRMLVEDDPVMPDFDEKAWAANRNTERDRKDVLLTDFALQRQASLNLLEQLHEGQWQRTGRHEVSGPMTVRSWVEHWAEHDETHIAQIERAIGETLDDVLARRAQPHATDEDA
jgi:hypothetical protein